MYAKLLLRNIHVIHFPYFTFPKSKLKQTTLKAKPDTCTLHKA